MRLPVIGSKKQPPITIEDILEAMSGRHSEQDCDLVRRAWEFSERVHSGQERKSGEPYLVHPMSVALILAEQGLDATSIAVGLLHDVLEDTHAEPAEIRDEFGDEVLGLVEGVTKISKISFRTREQEQAENFRKLLLAMVEDIRVLLVKLADRLHNMRTLEHLSPTAQARNARETNDIYAPLARRLGMGRVQAELEDLAFRYLEPDAYEQLKGEVESQPRVRQAFNDRVLSRIEQELQEEGIEAKVEHRVKNLASLHRKLLRQDRDLDRIYDVVAFRIITDTVKNCYAALGLVHGLWRPVPGRFKDFVAMPKPNMYQSLHTTVIDEGQPFELQIRTAQMHQVAEEGIAAHWLYKEGRSAKGDDDQQFQWLRQIVDLQREIPDALQFLSSLKVDLYPGEVYVFTPKGEVKVFPAGATPIDFAYAVHTEVGHHCTGAKINGALVPLRTPVSNGDIVEIITSTDGHPRRDWLRLVKTSRARSKIRAFINRRERDRSIEVGRRLVDKDLRRYGLNLKKQIASGAFEEIAPHFGVAKGEDVLAGVGYGKIAPKQVVTRLLPPEQLEETVERKKAFIPQTVRRVLGWDDEPVVTVEGMDDILVSRARCCDPIPGEAIVGYVTRGKGVSVHAADCANVEQLLMNPERQIPVAWQTANGSTQPIKLQVEVEDRRGLLAEITSRISDAETNIRHIDSHIDGGRGKITIIIDVADVAHLQRIRKVVSRIPGVLRLKRVGAR